MTNAPAPNSAAAPTAPVFIGAAAALELAPALAALEAMPAPLAVPADGVMMAEDGAGMPLVKGTLEAEWAPEKAAVAVEAVALGVAAVAAGLRTLLWCGGVSGGRWGRGEKGSGGLLVNDMDDAVGDEDVGEDDLGAVDEDAAVFDVDGQGLVDGGGEFGGVLEQGAVVHDEGHDVVADDFLQGRYADVAEHGADGLEGVVVRDEGCEVGGERGSAGGLGDGLDGAEGRGEVQGVEGDGEVLRDCQEGVDHVDDAAGEVDVLGRS